MSGLKSAHVIAPFTQLKRFPNKSLQIVLRDPSSD